MSLERWDITKSLTRLTGLELTRKARLRKLEEKHTLPIEKLEKLPKTTKKITAKKSCERLNGASCEVFLADGFVIKHFKSLAKLSDYLDLNPTSLKEAFKACRQCGGYDVWRGDISDRPIFIQKSKLIGISHKTADGWIYYATKDAFFKKLKCNRNTKKAMAKIKRDGLIVVDGLHPESVRKVYP